MQPVQASLTICAAGSIFSGTPSPFKEMGASTLNAAPCTSRSEGESPNSLYILISVSPIATPIYLLPAASVRVAPL